MATTRNARSFPLTAWMLIAAGVLYLLELLLSHIGVGGEIDNILVFLAYVALTIAFVVLFLGRSFDILLRVAFIVGAVGWALLALSAIASVGGGLIFIGELLALIGTLVAGVIVFARNIFSRRASIAFLVLAIVAAIYLLLALTTAAVGGTVLLVLAIIFGVMLVVAGFFMNGRR